MIEDLWKEYNEKKTLKERDELILACLPFVKSSARRLAIYTNSLQDVDDLINAGIIGLMDATKKYDPSKGASFKSYAQYRIRGAILDEVRSMAWAPHSTREKARRIEKLHMELERDCDKVPDEEDIAKAMGISMDQYYKTLLEVNRMTISFLDDIFHDGDNIPDNLEDKTARDPEQELIIAEIESMLSNAIEYLPEKERLVVTLYYYEEMTMKEIGKVIDLTESRVCQIHSSAILHLHARLKYITAEVSSKIYH